MEAKKMYGYGIKDRTKLEVIGVYLIVIVSWNITSLFLVFLVIAIFLK